MSSIGFLNASRFAGTIVELLGDPVEVVGGVDRQVGALRKVLAERAIRVFPFAPPRCQGECGSEVDVNTGIDRDVFPVAHLRSLVPGQRHSDSGSVLIFAARTSRTCSGW